MKYQEAIININKCILSLYNPILKQVQDDKNLFKLAIFLILLVPFFTGCSHKPILEIGGARFELELARTSIEQEKGLSGHKPLNSNEGMLFVFGNKSVKNFWMKDMSFPIDIIWLNDDKIVKIARELKPEGANPQNIHSSDEPVNKVLEIKAGRAEELDLKIGDKIIYEF